MAIYLALWDCPTCGKEGNLGPKTHCESCSAPRPRSVQFYMPNPPIIVENEAEMKLAASGVDWICGHCEAHNKAWKSDCQSCGNPKDEKSQDVQLQKKEYNEGEVPETGKIPRALNENEQAHVYGKSRRSIWVGLGLLVIVVAIIFGVFSIEKDIQVKITSFEWERKVEMEFYGPVAHEGWSLPQGAMRTKSFQAIHHYDKVFDHYETRTRTVREAVGQEEYVCGKTDMGNGYFQDRYCTRTIYESRQESYQEAVYRDVPIYRTKYQYELNEWSVQETLPSSGKDQKPIWASKNYPNANLWRTGRKTQNYWIYIKDNKNKTHKLEMPYEKWQKLSPKQKLPARARWITGNFIALSV